MTVVRAAMIRPCLVLSMLGAALSPAAIAQELNPRAYWPAPRGTTVLLVGYQRSQGDLLFDPSLPISGARSTVNVTQAGLQHTFRLLGRTANVQFAVPYSWGTADGFVADEYRRRDMAGFADLRARLSLNLVGAPSMDREAFRRLLASPRTIVGASVAVTSPTGRYDTDRLLNIGTHRWAIKPAIGVIQPLGRRWLLEVEVGSWFFTANDEFVGSRRTQAPLLSTELHVVKVFPSGLWLALDANFYAGGRTTVDDVVSFDLQRNSRLGATFTYPLGARRRHALRVSASTGLFTTRGGDFDSLGVAWIYVLP